MPQIQIADTVLLINAYQWHCHYYY